VLIAAAESSAKSDTVRITEPPRRLQLGAAACGQVNIGDQVPGGTGVTLHPLGDFDCGLIAITHAVSLP
jgi:hypothetical protein